MVPILHPKSWYFCYENDRLQDKAGDLAGTANETDSYSARTGARCIHAQ
jgi:hypothetical protein